MSPAVAKEEKPAREAKKAPAAKKKVVEKKTPAPKKVAAPKEKPDKRKPEQKTALELVAATRSMIAKRDIMPVSPRIRGWTSTDCWLIDLVLSNGRGIPWGVCLEILGPSGGGKTYLAMLMARAYLRRHYAVYWYNFENGWSETFAELCDLDQDSELFTLYPQTYAEHGLNSIVDITRSYRYQNTPALVVIDSLGRMNTMDRDRRSLEENRKGMGGGIAQVLNDFFTILASNQAVTNVTIIYINQEYKGMPTMPGLPAPTYTKGGAGPEYNAFLRLKLKPFEMVTDAKGVPRYGVVNARVVKSKLQMPQTRCMLPLFYPQTTSRVVGMDDAFTSLLYLVTLGGIQTVIKEKEEKEDDKKKGEKKSTADTGAMKLKWNEQEISFRALRDLMIDYPEVNRDIRDRVETAFRRYYKLCAGAPKVLEE